MQNDRRTARLFRALGALLVAAPLAVCAPAAGVSAPAPEAPPARTTAAFRADAVEGALSEHVVVISIDGLRPDAIGRFEAGTLQRLMREGSYSLQARTILPSITLPSHTSMLTGVGPEKHGITWNRNEVHEHGTVEVPTIFARAHEQGLRTAAFFSKGKFRHLIIPGTVDDVRVPEGNGKYFAGRTADNVEEFLRSGRPNLMFVHIGEPDYAGHVFGWMGTAYGWAVRRADNAVERVLRAADSAFGEGNYTVIVTADHGGHGRTHGSSDRRDVTIPWITWGKGVRAGTVLPEGIHTTDTAVTALWLLGVTPAEGGTAQPVTAAFDRTALPRMAASE